MMATQRVVGGELPSSIHYHPPLSLLPLPFDYFNFPKILFLKKIKYEIKMKLLLTILYVGEPYITSSNPNLYKSQNAVLELVGRFQKNPGQQTRHQLKRLPHHEPIIQIHLHYSQQ